MNRTISALALFMSLISPAMAGSLTVHEWGTFTSFMGSNGELMEGMHHEDEPLPGFVHGLKKEELQDKAFEVPTRPRPKPCRPNSKVGCEGLMSLIQSHSELLPEAPVSAGVTQKMETPVIYFYGDIGQKVNVEINFPQGIITQYYPEASFSYPKLSEVRDLKDGRFVFDVTLLHPADQKIPSVKVDSIWAPARQVAEANAVEGSNGEHEKFIFYRGIGNFGSPLKVTSDAHDLLTLENLSASRIPTAVVINSDGKKGNFVIVKNLANKVQVVAPDAHKGMDFAQYVVNTKAAIAEALMQNGLYKDEAQAMVNTWEKSYFKTPGLRVLYIVPSVDTENILPLAVKPAPAELKRVLVGRVEVMTKNEEEKYIELLQTNATIDREAVFGRFYEPKLRHLEQIAPSSLKNKIKNLYQD